MSRRLHPWWQAFGQLVDRPSPKAPIAAIDFVAAIRGRNSTDVTLVGIREDGAGVVAICLDVEVERPQDLAFPISGVEPIAIVFGHDGERPSILALRPDFPDTPHQNWSRTGAPCSLCVDDRPWQEARLTYSPAELISRTQLWLAKAACGDLQDNAQPLDPLFFRSSLSIVVPPSVFALTDGSELAAFQHPSNPLMVIARPAPNQAGNFTVIAFAVPPQVMARRMRSPPTTLGALADAMAEMGLDLLTFLRERLREWSGVSPGKLHRLSTQLVVLIDFPMTSADGQTIHDPRAFVTHSTVGAIGVSIGVMLAGPAASHQSDAFVPAIVPDLNLRGEGEEIDPAQVYLTFTRPMATAIAGRKTDDTRKVVLVGGGSLGSQMSINLCREGRFIWTVIDNDYLLPHNLARHGLPSAALGAPKASALAVELGNLLGERFEGVVADVLDPRDAEPAVVSALLTADAIIDASASVAVSRHLSDVPDASARRVSTFFNPAGTAVVVLAEPTNRDLTLRDLEAQYHAAVQTNPDLTGHLASVEKGVSYSGSCRALTNRIPAARAAQLSALAAQGVASALDSQNGSISIWTLAADGSVAAFSQAPSAVHRVDANGWAVTYDDRLVGELVQLRASYLPAETGGVLLGIIDMSAKSIHVVHALPEPTDSSGTVSGFERGVVGLSEAINHSIGTSLFQVRYVGEWHSHPRRASAKPSTIDLAQLAWLSIELDAEGLPALMCIVADNGTLNVIIGQVREGSGRDRD